VAVATVALRRVCAEVHRGPAEGRMPHVSPSPPAGGELGRTGEGMFRIPDLLPSEIRERLHVGGPSPDGAESVWPGP